MSRALWNATKSLWEEILQKGKFIPRAATSSSFPSPSNYDNLINSFAIIALNWTGTFQKLTDYNIGWLSAKLLHDPLEAGVFSDFGCGVNILDGEQGAQAEQEDLGQSGHELKQGNSSTLSRRPERLPGSESRSHWHSPTWPRSAGGTC